MADRVHLKTNCADSIRALGNDQACIVRRSRAKKKGHRCGSRQCSWIATGFLPRTIKADSNRKNNAADVSTIVAADEMSKEKLNNIPAAPQNAPSSGETISRV